MVKRSLSSAAGRREKKNRRFHVDVNMKAPGD
jgi:hypothetical protein